MYKKEYRFKEDDYTLYDTNITSTLDKLLAKKVKLGQQIVVLCIGTDLSVGDSLAPLVGSSLRDENIEDLKVYGILGDTANATNLADVIDNIYSEYDSPFIIAVDASLGKVSSFHDIVLREEPLYPGIGVGKDLGEVGDISILGIVGSNFLELKHETRLGDVIHIARVISSCLSRSLISYLSNSSLEEVI